MYILIARDLYVSIFLPNILKKKTPLWPNASNLQINHIEG